MQPNDSITEVVVQPWERQAKETDMTFDAFRTYRDIMERHTFAKCAEKLGCSETNVRRWARDGLLDDDG